jgi:lipopolysaccharide/colanic/teichoic acid biosynthesis glycosyltransferase
MSVFPILIDSRPAYLEALDVSSSLLTLPLGTTTIGRRLSARLLETTRRKPAVLCAFDHAEEHPERLRIAGASFDYTTTIDKFLAGLASFEPSDWLLFVDPRCTSLALDPTPLLGGLDDTPRMVRHLIALDMNSGGTKERVELDGQGCVRRVQRYYDAVTWALNAGVPCSLVPVSAFTLCGVRPFGFGSLVELRRELAARAVPSRDVAITERVFDLTTERGLLRLNERALALEGGGTHTAASLHPSVRLYGPVAIHDGAKIEEDTTLIGPAVIGGGAQVGRGAVVAQSVAAAGAVIHARAVVRHRVVAGTATDEQSTLRPSYSDDTEPPAVAIDESAPAGRWYPKVKTILEAILAGGGLIVVSPLLALVAILIKLESQGPVFFGDPRESKDGRPFYCYKFRTMYVGADAAQRDLMQANQVDGPQFKIDRDPRITRLGRWLRMFSIDELPQLMNVAMGQMSLVGPRPSPFRENQTCVPWRDARLSVRPGITGLWQVCRHDRSSGDFHQWIYYDMQYVRHMSFLLDLKIVIATVITLGGKGHVPLSWMIATLSKEHV